MQKISVLCVFYIKFSSAFPTPLIGPFDNQGHCLHSKAQVISAEHGIFYVRRMATLVAFIIQSKSLIFSEGVFFSQR